MSAAATDWPGRADQLQEALMRCYWDPSVSIMKQWYPGPPGADENFYYWWQAHVLDVWVDAWERSGSELWLERIRALAGGLRRCNGDTFRHHYYDDMEWTALALLRVYNATGEQAYLDEVLDLWADIRTAWNDHMGGGMAWKKDQLDYKNTPANAPAVILAARLYRLLGETKDLAWAERIYSWNRQYLVDPGTGFVWDGMNRLGDGAIDKDWEFTYCQGVYIGAALELYKVTGEAGYLEDAQQTGEAARQRFVDTQSGMLPDEGIDDTGLFKGILVRYVVLLMQIDPGSAEAWQPVMRHNGEVLWRQGREPGDGLTGPHWQQSPQLPVQLSVQLSSLMLLEALAADA